MLTLILRAIQRVSVTFAAETANLSVAATGGNANVMVIQITVSNLQSRLADVSRTNNLPLLAARQTKPRDTRPLPASQPGITGSIKTEARLTIAATGSEHRSGFTSAPIQFLLGFSDLGIVIV